MKGSRRDFVHGALFGGLIASLISRAAFTFAEIESRPVDRRRFGRVGAEVSVLGLGLGAAFMDAFEHRLEAGHTLLESALARGINYWDTGRSYGPSEGMIAPVLGRNRSRVFLASAIPGITTVSNETSIGVYRYSRRTMLICINCMIWVRRS
jgi:aryl-alcohol dehydrogenase-like predicted oxidoreductase